MMWIDVVPFEEAEGLLKEVYERQAATLGKPTELTMLGSLYPALAAARSDLYRVVEACPSSMTPLERQAVALAATAPLGSTFLTAGVEAKYLSTGGSTDQANDFKAGRLTGLSAKAAALARYARLVATAPEKAERSDIEACRGAGATDLDILDANNLASYYAYLARVCLGLGLSRGSSPDS
jgi:uncharacterized protein YciW